MARKKAKISRSHYPGEDPERRCAIENSLTETFKPKDILEEIWINEISRLTASIEHYSDIEAFINQELVARCAPLSSDDGEGAGYLGIENPFHIRRALGRFSLDDLKHLAAIADITAAYRRERERIYAQFERKRRIHLMETVSIVEHEHSPRPALEAPRG